MPSTTTHAFTLLELLVVIAIIGLLSSVVITSVNSARGKANIAKLMQMAAQINNRVGAYEVAGYLFEEGSGQTVSGNGGSCTLAGDATFTPNTYNEEVSKYAIAFDGSGDYIDCGDTGNVYGDELTIMYWSYWNDAGDQDHPIVAKNPTTSWTPGEGYVVGTGWGNDFRVGIGNNIAVIGSASGIQQDEWQFYVVTYRDGEGMKLYTNGELKYENASFSGLVGTNTERLTIGRARRNGYWLGMIDDVHVYESSIFAEDVRALYLAGLERMYSEGNIDEEEYSARVASVR